jgi:hypothetical protein
MKRHAIVAALLLAGAGGSLRADDAPRPLSPGHTAASHATDPSFTMTPLTPTPEMWYYEQEKRERSDRKAAVRRKAEFDTAQRQQRLAMMAWYGISPSRPTMICTPFTGSSSGQSGGPNGRDIRHAGSGTTAGAVMIQPPVSMFIR